ncbi:hypothetical protein ACQBAR_13710 [Propionibacteriaceae bacterium Y1685]|uniref:hypothetical protein n=1 Tax=Microlunatus sp. Y1700 TaxID=3418487 RepID=UPI003B7E97B4
MRLPLRTLLATAVTAALVTTTAAIGQAAPPAATAGTVVDLGNPMTVANVRSSGAGPDGKGGGLLYATSDGTPASFTVIDAETGNEVFRWESPLSETIGGSMTATEHGTYFKMRSGSRTVVYEYDALTNEVTEVVTGCGSGCPITEPVIRNIVLGEDGTMFMSLYPDTGLQSYNPQTKEVRNYGEINPADTYAWGLTKAGNDLYVGTGIGDGGLFKVNIDSGAKTEIPLPEGNAGTKNVHALTTAGKYVLAALAGTPTLGIYDTETQAWACTGTPFTGKLPSNNPLSVSTEDGKIFFRSGNEFHEFDSATCAVRAIGFDQKGVDATNLGSTLLVPTADGLRVGGLDKTGRAVLADPASGAATEHKSIVVGAPATTHSLGMGPDGNIYMGAYLSSGVMARIDPATNQTEKLIGPSQAGSMAAVGGQLIIGSYPDGVVHTGDMSKPWSYGENPRKLLELIGHDQDRLFDIVDAGGLAAVGTVSEYGTLGGSLTLFDPVKGNPEVFKVAKDQSVVTLAYRDGVVYGGTSIHNGLSTTPTTTEGQIFGFDVASRTTKFLDVPVPGDETVATVAFGRSSNILWGMTYENHLFGYDVTTGTVTTTIKVDLPSAGANWGRTPEMQWNAQQRRFYGVAGHALFSFNPANKKVTVLDRSKEWKGIQVTGGGDIYLIDGLSVYEYVPA